MAGLTVRRGETSDLQAVTRIQDASPELAHWDASDYLAYHFLVAESDGLVVGFIAARVVVAGEVEILNLAVAPSARRRGVARRLLTEIRSLLPGVLYLEVRESNLGARTFYQVYGFMEVNLRPGYYENPRETAIVMKFHSC
jgi:ribosomal-protein-alanine N-acetyltransferase